MKTNRRLKKTRIRPLPSATTIKAGGRHLSEIFGLIVLGLTALVILSLISHNADDPAFSNNYTSLDHPTRNWIGPFGAHLADGLLQAFGWGGWMVPLLTFYLTLVLFIPPRAGLTRRFLRLTGLVLVTLAITGLPSGLGMQQDPFYGVTTPPGGAVGEVIGYLLKGFFGAVGASIILLLTLPLGVILTTGMSLRQLGSHASTLGAAAWRALVALLTRPFLKEAPAGDDDADDTDERGVRAPGKPRQPRIVEKPREPKVAPPPPPTRQVPFAFKADGAFELPSLNILDTPPAGAKKTSHDTLVMNSRILEKKLKDFGIDGQVTHVHPGPVITMYEYAPAAGIKVNRIANLADDLAMAMSAISVRVVAPIPGKAVVGIEIPNAESETVFLQEVLNADDFKKGRSRLTFALGKDIFGTPVSGDLARMPHLLIAGATGSGKSVMLNTLICSILFRATPEQVKFLFVDPKMVEMMPYEGIPHLICPVVTNPKKASWALKNVVAIMEGRYKILADRDAKNIETYNQLVADGRGKTSFEGVKDETMPYLVVVIDELADLMMLASNDVEDSVTRLAQMARAVGIHLVLATQRPSVNVITGVIKANLPTRISFQVSSKNDSRIILDANGAESLLGKGDMLYLPPGASKLRRIHGAYISEDEIRRVVEFVKKQGSPSYDENILKPVEEDDDGDGNGDDIASDEKYREAIELVRRTGQASISMIQRRLRVGYNRAARMVEQMEKEGIISPADGIRPRRIIGAPAPEDD
jgi:S-DNA-T family DNA segregation ATPase FtsK/SpoIIIE